MKKILLFASGTGSNVENILKYFKINNEIEVVSVFSNNPKALVLAVAAHHNVPTYVFDKEGLTDGRVLNKLLTLRPDLIVLAGFLWKMPEQIVQQYSNKIINIHPALLPKFGGKGMYGHFVHEAVVAAGEKESGITIHYVNEHYDEGGTIFQSSFPVLPSDTAEDVAKKGQVLEHRDFPRVIESLVNP